MFRSRRAPVAALATTAALVAAGSANAQRLPNATPQGPVNAPISDLELPILPLEAPISSLDGSVSRTSDEKETTITLSADVLFRFDKASLSGKAKSRLKEVAGDIERADPDRVSIEGHTDSKGSDAYNDGLSKRRADAVRKVLDRELDGGPTLAATGRGESEPVAEEKTEDGEDSPKGRSRNRRVEIRIPR